MSEYRKIDDVIKEKERYIEEYDAKISAWGAVTVKKKKDGKDFASLTKACIDGARIADKTYTDGKEIAVYYTANNRPYNCDSIDCFKYVEQYGVKTILTPSELRERIAERIALYEQYKAETENALAWLEANKTRIENEMESFRNAILGDAPDDIGIRHAFADIVSDGIKYGFR